MSRKKATSSARKREPRRKGREVVLSNAARTPVGAILRHGKKIGSPGPYDGRRLKHYCLVYTLAGRTNYEDHVIGKRILEPGDLLLIHPGIAHWYGDRYARNWDEYFIVFEGPLFDFWKKKGLLDPRNPIVRLEPIPYWLRRLESCVAGSQRHGSAGNIRRLVGLLEFLAEVRDVQQASQESRRPAWLARACGLLGADLGKPIEWNAFSQSLGLSTKTFRKLFSHAMGVPPSRYRMAKIIDRACELSADERLLQKEVASELGFATEQFFSRRFKQMTGLTFSQFRQQWSSGNPRAVKGVP